MSLPLYVGELQWRKLVVAAFALLPSQRLAGSKTYDPPNLAAGASTSTTVTVTGAVLGQPAQACFSLDTAGVALAAMVTAADTVTVILTNTTGGAVDLASGTLSAFAWVA